MFDDIWNYLGYEAQSTICSDNAQTIIDYFSRHPEQINTQDKQLNTPLHLAHLYSEEKEILTQWLLEHGANVNLENHIGRSMLYYITRRPDEYNFHMLGNLEKTLQVSDSCDKAYQRHLIFRAMIDYNYASDFIDFPAFEAQLIKHHQIEHVTYFLSHLDRLALSTRLSAYLKYSQYQSPELNAAFLASIGAVKFCSTFSLESFNQNNEIWKNFQKLCELPFAQGKEHYYFMSELSKRINDFMDANNTALHPEVFGVIFKTIDFSLDGGEYMDLIASNCVLHHAYLNQILSNDKAKKKFQKI